MSRIMDRTHDSTTPYGGGRKIGSRRRVLVWHMDMRIGHKPLGQDAANHWANHADISQVLTGFFSPPVATKERFEMQAVSL